MELTFIAFTLLFILFYRYRCISSDDFTKCWKIIKFIFGIKVIVWGAIQLIIFLRGIPDNCITGLHSFGLINALIHVLLLSAVLAEAGSMRKKVHFIALQLFIVFFNFYFGHMDTDELIIDTDSIPVMQRYQWLLRLVGIV